MDHGVPSPDPEPDEMPPNPWTGGNHSGSPRETIGIAGRDPIWRIHPGDPPLLHFPSDVSMNQGPYYNNGPEALRLSSYQRPMAGVHGSAPRPQYATTVPMPPTMDHAVTSSNPPRAVFFNPGATNTQAFDSQPRAGHDYLNRSLNMQLNPELSLTTVEAPTMDDPESGWKEQVSNYNIHGSHLSPTSAPILAGQEVEDHQGYDRDEDLSMADSVEAYYNQWLRCHGQRSAGPDEQTLWPQPDSPAGALSAQQPWPVELAEFMNEQYSVPDPYPQTEPSIFQDEQGPQRITQGHGGSRMHEYSQMQAGSRMPRMEMIPAQNLRSTRETLTTDDGACTALSFESGQAHVLSTLDQDHSIQCSSGAANESLQGPYFHSQEAESPQRPRDLAHGDPTSQAEIVPTRSHSFERPPGQPLGEPFGPDTPIPEREVPQETMSYPQSGSSLTPTMALDYPHCSDGDRNAQNPNFSIHLPLFNSQSLQQASPKPTSRKQIRRREDSKSSHKGKKLTPRTKERNAETDRVRKRRACSSCHDRKVKVRGTQSTS